MTTHAMNDGQLETNYLYVWIGRDLDGVEGVLSADVGGLVMPLVATNRSLALSLAGLARHNAVARQQSVHLVQFLRGETLRSITPPGA